MPRRHQIVLEHFREIGHYPHVAAPQFQHGGSIDAGFTLSISAATSTIYFTTGEYDDDVANNSTWEETDWNGDLEFTSADLVAAFQTGNSIAAAETNRSLFDADSQRFNRRRRNGTLAPLWRGFDDDTSLL